MTTKPFGQFTTCQHSDVDRVINIRRKISSLLFVEFWVLKSSVYTNWNHHTISRTVWCIMGFTRPQQEMTLEKRARMILWKSVSDAEEHPPETQSRSLSHMLSAATRFVHELSFIITTKIWRTKSPHRVAYDDSDVSWGEFFDWASHSSVSGWGHLDLYGDLFVDVHMRVYKKHFTSYPTPDLVEKNPRGGRLFLKTERLSVPQRSVYKNRNRKPLQMRSNLFCVLCPSL